MRIKPPNKAKLRVAILTILSIALVLGMLSYFFPFPESSEWGFLSIGTSEKTIANPDWLSGWSYRKSLNITGQSGAGTNYQILLKVGETSGASGEDFDVNSHCEYFPYDITFTDNDETTELDYWIDSITGTTPNQLATFWVEVADDLSSGTIPIYCYYGNENIELARYLAQNWTPASNPLSGDLGSGYWMTGFYNDYDSNIYLIYQPTHLGKTAKCFSFGLSDWDNYSNWTDEGVVLTKSTYDTLEPHGVIFETQAMADAREGVGEGLGTRKWRLYYAGSSSANVPVGFATAPENDATNWTDYGGVYGYGTSYHGTERICDPDAFIFNNEVWMAVKGYTGARAGEQWYTSSSDGIDNWDDCDQDFDGICSVVWGTNYPTAQGISCLTNWPTGKEISACFTPDGEEYDLYNCNPVIPYDEETWDESAGACFSLIENKNESYNISGYAYGYWYGRDSSNDHRIGGARTPNLTLVEEPYNASGNGTATFILFDDFERGSNDDTIGGDWTEVQAHVHISTDFAYCGTRSGKWVTPVSGAPEATIPITASDSIAIRFRYYRDDAANNFMFNHGDGSTVAYPYIEADEDFVYYDTATRDTGYDVTADSWNLIELNDFDWAANTFDIWLDGVQIEDDAGEYSSSIYNDLLDVRCNQGSVGEDNYIDDLIVRKYVYPEPAFGACGDEESIEAEITNTPSTNDFGILAVNSTSNTAINYFTLNNTGNCAVDVAIQGTDLTSNNTEEQLEYDTATIHVYSGNVIRAGQRLTITSRNVTGLAFVLLKSGSPTGDVTFTIRKVSDSSIMASKVWGDASLLATDPAWYEVTFDSPVFVNQEVRICVEFSGGNFSNYVGVKDTSNRSVKPDEMTTYYISSWGDASTTDTAYNYTYSYNWTLSDTATPGENIYGLKAGLDDDDDTFDTIVRKTETYNTLVSDLAEDATQDWGLKIWMPTALSGYGNQEMTATITLVASEAS